LRSPEKARVERSSAVTKSAFAPLSQFEAAEVDARELAPVSANTLIVVGNNTEYECTTCQEKLFGYNDIIQHMHQHTSPGTFLCHLCNKALESKSALGSHFLLHLGVTFTCSASNCEEKFSAKHLFLEHLKTHTGWC